MQTANEYLHGILGVLYEINRKIESKPQVEEGVSDTEKTAMSGLGLSTPKEDYAQTARDIKDMSKALKDLSVSMAEISELSGKKGEFQNAVSWMFRTLDHNKMMRAAEGLHKFGESLEFVADKSRTIERLSKMFENLGDSTRELNRFSRSVGLLLLSIAGSIVAFAGGLLLAGVMLGTTPMGALGIVALTALTMVGIVTLLALSSKITDKGNDVVRNMGIGMLALAGGIISFALTLAVLPSILGIGGKGENAINKSLVTMLKIIGASILMFVGIGLASPLIKKGVGVVFMMSLGMVALSAGITVVALAAKLIHSLNMGKSDEQGEEDPNKRAVMKGLGTMGIVILGAVALFSLLGIPVVSGLVMLGAVTAIVMAGALIAFSFSVKKLVSVAKDLEGEPIKQTLTSMISGVLGGLTDGLTLGLTGDAKGWKGVKNAIKNTAVLMAGVGILFSVSLSLSMFAKALTAFAELNNMRVIKGYKEDGEPIFGDRIDISQVSQNIAFSISTFLTSLIDATVGLSNRQARAIKKMGGALTGRRGILSAVIQFADALKVYAEFGPKGEIGYIEYDDEGNEIRKKVGIDVVTQNMISSFMTFVTHLAEGTEDLAFSGRTKRKLKRMSKALIGKKGILGAVIEFADTLKLYSAFGENNEIPIRFDPETGEVLETIEMDKVAKNIADSLISFSSILSEKFATTEGKWFKKSEAEKDIKNAEKFINKFSDLIDGLGKLTKSVEGIERISGSLRELAESIGMLTTNLVKLNTDKLGKVAEASETYLAKTNDYDVSTQRVMEKTTVASMRSPVGRRTDQQQELTPGRETVVNNVVGTQPEQPDWKEIADRIGSTVGSQVAASLKNGMFKFEFDSTKSDGATGVYFWEPR